MNNYSKEEVRISLTRIIAEDYLSKVDKKVGASINFFRKKLEENFNMNSATVIKGYIPQLNEYIDNHPFVSVKEVQGILLDEIYPIDPSKSPVVINLMKEQRDCIKKFNEEMNEDLYQLVNIHLLSEALNERKYRTIA